MAIETNLVQNWLHVSAPGRMDAFNFVHTKAELEAICQSSSQVALDLSGVQFINLPSIQLIHNMAVQLSQRGGRLALVGMTERLKKQFRIFASLDPFMIISADGWEKLVNTRIEGNS